MNCKEIIRVMVHYHSQKESESSPFYLPQLTLTHSKKNRPNASLEHLQEYPIYLLHSYVFLKKEKKTLSNSSPSFLRAMDTVYSFNFSHVLRFRVQFLWPLPPLLVYLSWSASAATFSRTDSNRHGASPAQVRGKTEPSHRFLFSPQISSPPVP